jgi:hypothetical protein
MGISAKKFGPVAWKFLESIAVFCDAFIAREQTVLRRTLMRALFARAVFSIGFLLPCVYCRFSFRAFTNPVHPLNESVDIITGVHLPDGCKKLVYNLHVAVNKKLEKQDIETAFPEQVCAVHKKWTEYNISYEEALDSRFGQRSAPDVWVYLTTLIAFIICDYDVLETREHTCGLFASISDMFALAVKASPWLVPSDFMEKLATLRPVLSRKSSWGTKHSRQTMAWTTHRAVLEAGMWSERMATRSAIFQMCSAEPLCAKALSTIKKGSTKNVEKNLVGKQEKCSSKV